MNIGKLIYTRRKELNLTLEDIGKAVGVSKSTVKKWESGYIANIKRDKIAALAKVLNINPVTFIDDTLIPGNNSFEISAHERELLLAYRAKPEMQASIDKLLDIKSAESKTIADDVIDTINSASPVNSPISKK